MVRDVIVLLLNHALGVRAELFRERGKRAFRGEEGEGEGRWGEGTSLWQDTQTWPALPLIRGIVEDTLHLK